MPKRRPNEEIFKDGDREIKLVADFGFLVAVNSSSSRDVSEIYTDLSNGLTPPDDVRNVLAAAVPDDGPDIDIEDLITRYGLQECAIMARVMLSHAMIGDVKKSAIERQETLRSVVDSLAPSRSMTLWRVGLLWTAATTVSTLLVCTIFSVYGLPF